MQVLETVKYIPQLQFQELKIHLTSSLIWSLEQEKEKEKENEQEAVEVVMMELKCM